MNYFMPDSSASLMTFFYEVEEVTESCDDHLHVLRTDSPNHNWEEHREHDVVVTCIKVGRETGWQLHSPKPLAHGSLLICREVVARARKVHFPTLRRQGRMKFRSNVLVHKILM